VFHTREGSSDRTDVCKTLSSLGVHARSVVYLRSHVFKTEDSTKRELARAHNHSQTHHHIHRAPKIRFQGARRASLHQAEPDLIITQGFSHTRTRWASLQQRRVKHVVAKERVGEACPLKKGQVDPSLCFCLLIEISETKRDDKIRTTLPQTPLRVCPRYTGLRQ